MTDTHPPTEMPINEGNLNKLIRAITLSQGNFSLILARCNYGSLRDRMVQQLKTQCPISIRELYLPPSIKTLYTTIKAELGDEQPQALMIFGLEQVQEIDRVLISTNQVREEFRKDFLFPIVLWVNDDTLKHLIQLMPDFKSWTGNSIKFEVTQRELAESLEQPMDGLFEAILNLGAGKFPSLVDLYPQGAHLSAEWESALVDLGSGVADRLQASLKFWAGREADLRGEKAQAKAAYEQSIAFWQTEIKSGGMSAVDWARYGCVLFHLGLWWRQQAIQQRAESTAACLQAKDFYQQSLTAFDRTDRPELVAKFIIPLGEVLNRLQQWEELAEVAKRTVRLHQAHPEPFRLAYAYGLLAEVSLHRQDWAIVKNQAELALQTNALPSPSTIDWSLIQSQYKNLYLLLLAQGQCHLQQEAEAIKNLETAKANFQPQYNPTIYIRILEELRSLYFEQGQYLQAFETKQEQRSIEQQYGLRAFVGAGRLQSRQQVMPPGLAVADTRATMTQEIEASGRSQDVNRLLERLGRNDHKLTVIYGQSGVGKSSLVQAGLVPALKQRSIEARDVVPVLLQVYTDWTKNVGDRLAESMAEVRGLSMPLLLDSMATFVAEIKKNGDKNLLTVLIFDQFEEFFFAYKDPVQRRPFFEFMRDCLNVPYVKVILSLREDYLHYLLECNRLTHLAIIDNNILDKKILYYLGNLLPEDGRAVIQSLTAACQLSLEPELIDELVRDLAGDMQEVRPIELQVVGAQMQTEQVMTLAQYQETGPKDRFVGRFLEEVLRDCGTNNEQFAKVILYLLTDDNLTRPLKTRAELMVELDVTPERLDLILNILVKSGLVFQIPGFPADRFQLVHDYLVPFVRQQQAAGMVAELEKEREQRKLTEARLNQVLKQQLKTARRGILTLSGLVVTISGIAVVAIVSGINIYVSGQNLAPSNAKGQLDRLVTSIKTVKQQKALAMATLPEFRLKTALNFANTVNTMQEVSRLEGHTGNISSVEFSPDSLMVATASEDKTARLWKPNGEVIATLSGHTDKVNHVSFSSDGKMVATASEDNTVRLWKLDGTLLRTLSGHESSVTKTNFSPDGKMLATVSKDKKVKVWQVDDGKLLKTITNETIATVVRFSPDGKVLAIGSKDDVVQLWNLDGQAPTKTINNYGAIDLRFSTDGNTLASVNRDQTLKIWFLDGTLIKTIERICYGNSDSFNLNPDATFVTGIHNIDGKVFIFSILDELCIEGRLDSKSDLAANRVISLSPDGQLVTASQDKSVKISRIDHITRLNNGNQLLLTDDWQTTAVEYIDKKVGIKSRNNNTQKTLPINSSILKFSPDNKTLLTSNDTDTIYIWNEKGQKIILQGYIGSVSSVISSPDGQLIAAVGEDNAIRLWSQDGTLLKILIGNKKPISKIKFSPNGKILAAVGLNIINLWNQNGDLLKRLPGHFTYIRDIQFSPDSEFIASMGDDNFVKLWRSDGKFVETLKHSDRVKSISFSPNSKVLVSLSGSFTDSNPKINFWQNQNSALLASIIGYGVSEIAFSPDGNTLVAIGSSKVAQFFDLRGVPLLKQTIEHNNGIRVATFSPDGEILATGGGDNTIKLTRMDDTSDPLLIRGHEYNVSNILFSPDGRLFISVSSDNTVKLWSRDGKEIRTFLKPKKETDNYSDFTINVKFSADSPNAFLIQNGRGFKEINQWSINGKEIKMLKSRGYYGKAEFKRDDNSIVITSSEPTLKLWNLEGNLLGTFKDHADQINATSFSPDGKLLASASDDKTVKLWQSDGTLLKTLPHEDKVNSVSFSPDGKFLASASDDKTVKLWQSNGTLLKTLPHEDKVNSVSFSPDGKLLASASDDKTVKLWQSDGTFLKTLPHEDKVNSVSFSPDSQFFVSIGQAGAIKLWKSNGKEVDVITEADGEQKIARFSPNSRMLAIYNSRGSSSFRLYNIDSIWAKRTTISLKETFSDILFSSDSRSINVTTGNEIKWLDLTLDGLLKQSCDLVKDYLKNSPSVEEGDRNLCDDIK